MARKDRIGQGPVLFKVTSSFRICYFFPQLKYYILEGLKALFNLKLFDLDLNSGRIWKCGAVEAEPSDLNSLSFI